MRAHAALIFCFLRLSLPAWLWGQAVEFLPIDQVQAGARGVGRTVFEGVTLEEFDVEILGVLEKVAPQQNMILARLSGEKIEKTGVFAGMSGSPVYIDDKLVGAIAFAFPFSKEPIAGITPIHEMVEIFRDRPSRPIRSASARVEPARLYRVSSTSDFLTWQSLPERRSWSAPGWADSGRLYPIVTPLSLGGLSPSLIDFFGPAFGRLGMVPAVGLASARGKDFGDAPLQPGSTVAVHLIRGDMDASASGTVTHIASNRIYAFGHPFMGVGFTDMPLSKGAVLTVISSLASSQKVTATTSFVGSVKQDRASGLVALRDEQPQLLPVGVTVTTSRNQQRSYRFELVTDPFLTPFLTALVVFNSLYSSEKMLGGQTLQVRSSIDIKGQASVRFVNTVSGMVNSGVTAALTAAAPLDLLLGSGFDDLKMEQVEIEITAVEEIRQARLETVFIDRTEVPPGEEVQLTLFLQKANGKQLVEKYPVKIPSEIAEGPLQVFVGEGLAALKMDQDTESARFVPRSSGQLIRAINNLKKNDRLYIRLYRSEPGVLVGGEGMPGLPPSMVELYGSDREAGSVRAINKVVYVEHELPETGFVLEGHQVFEIQVKN